MDNTSDLLFAVFNGGRELTEEINREVLDFAAFVRSLNAVKNGQDCK